MLEAVSDRVNIADGATERNYFGLICSLICYPTEVLGTIISVNRCLIFIYRPGSRACNKASDISGP